MTGTCGGGMGLTTCALHVLRLPVLACVHACIPLARIVDSTHDRPVAY